MELRPGYKRTDVGVIPDDWEVRSLKEISPSQCVGLVINPSSYFCPEGTVPMLVGSNILPNRIDSSYSHRIRERDNAKLSASRIYYGDLVVVRVGAPGTSAVVPFELDGCNCASMMIVRRDKTFDSDWLCAAFNSQIGRRCIEAVQYGTAQKQFNISDAVNFKFPVPCLSEQVAISAAIKDADAAIAALSRLIAKKRDLRQGAMQRLLTGGARLPGFSVPWRLKRLGELGDIRSGGTPATSEPSFWDGGIPWCTPTDITRLSGRKHLVETCRTISEKGLAGSSAELIPAASLIMTSRATIGECAINVVPVATNQGFKNIIVRENTNVEFLFYLMSRQKARLVSLCGGSTFLEIGKKQLDAFELFLPQDKHEQAAIAGILSDMDAEIATLEARLEKTRTLKQAMMQALLTGRIRLPLPREATLRSKKAAYA